MRCFCSWKKRTHLHNPTNATNTKEPTVHKIFNQNQFSNSYKTDERIIKNIIANNVQCSNKSDTLKFIPYYRSTVTNLISKIIRALPPNLWKKLTICQYKCLHGDCEHHNNIYIGKTTTTLPRRLTVHLASEGSIQHVIATHKRRPRKQQKILLTEFNHNKLSHHWSPLNTNNATIH